MKALTTIFVVLFFFSACKSGGNNGNNDRRFAVEKTFLYKKGNKYQKEQLEELSRLELMLMESEIFGRYGILKGNKWQKEYIKLKTWFDFTDNASEENITGIDKLNLTLIRKLIKDKLYLIGPVNIPRTLSLKTTAYKFSLNENKEIKNYFGKISPVVWKTLLNKEYGQEKRNPVIKKALDAIKGYTGFYKVYKDNNNRIRMVENYAGCCSVILSHQVKERFIFNKQGKLIKYQKYYQGNKEEEKFYFYKNVDSSVRLKEISIVYSLKTGKITEVSVNFRKL